MVFPRLHVNRYDVELKLGERHLDDAFSSLLPDLTDVLPSNLAVVGQDYPPSDWQRLFLQQQLFEFRIDKLRFVEFVA